jgi:hypothetical protein
MRDPAVLLTTCQSLVGVHLLLLATPRPALPGKLPRHPPLIEPPHPQPPLWSAVVAPPPLNPNLATAAVENMNTFSFILIQG